MSDTAQVLQRLCETPGPSGYESAVAQLVREYFEPLCDAVKVDALGNVIAVKRGEGPEPRPKIMWAAHMDEIGFMVTKIEKGGFLRVTSVGGVDLRNVLGQEVVVHTSSGDLRGIIGATPPHLTQEEERRKPVPMDKLYVDVGLSEERARELVSPGDVITIYRPFRKLAGRRVTAKALDNRAAVACLHHALKVLRGLRHRADVYAVATVQEEVGLRGATTGAYGVAPDAAIAVDVGFAHQPGLNKRETVEMGKGPSVMFGANIHPGLHQHLIDTARRFHIPYQIEVTPGRTGTDAWAIQVSRDGIPTGLISIPLRHMHSPAEVLDLDDLEAAGQLLALQAAALDWDILAGWTPALEPAPDTSPADESSPGARAGIPSRDDKEGTV